jgi:hypothetical protein
VVVAPTRQAALDRAASLADVVVLDGVSQTAPRRASLALLALDEASPWGAGGVVPRGDLRAPREALLGATDHVVTIGDGQIRSRGAFGPGTFLTWAELSRLRVGLFVALSRPCRLLAFLARRGIDPTLVVRVPDHGLDPSAIRAHVPLRTSSPLDLWLASPKCALHLEAAGIPHAVLEHSIQPTPSLSLCLANACLHPPRLPGYSAGVHLHAPGSPGDLAP